MKKIDEPAGQYHPSSLMYNKEMWLLMNRPDAANLF